MSTTKFGLTIKEWETAKQDIINILVEQALLLGDVQPITYKELCAKLKSPFPDCPNSNELRTILDEIDKEEYELGHGLLTSFVHNNDLGYPGPGFFSTAKKLGFTVSATEESKLEFTYEQMRRVAREQRMLKV